MGTQLVCSVCGHRFFPDEQARSACQTCPLNKGCQMVCCPVCGNTDVDPTQSKLVQWVTQIFGGKTVESSISDR